MAGVSPTEGPGTRQQRITSAALCLNRESRVQQLTLVLLGPLMLLEGQRSRGTRCFSMRLLATRYECDACGTKDIRAGKNINHLLAHLSTRKCNFKESEAAKEMAKTDDNVKEFLEKMGGELLLNEYAATCDEVRARIDMAPYVSITCDAWSPNQGGEHILGWCVAWSGHAFMLDVVHTEDASVTALFMKEKLDLILVKHNLPGAGQGQLAAGQPGAGQGQLAAAQPAAGSFGCEEAANLFELAAMSKLFNERVVYGETGALYATGLLDPRMWMSSYIYFNRRALKGTRGQTRSSEEERAEFEEWLQHQPNGISE
ncbi:hypothetical protein V8C86DRAFT_3142431 [Haematococcus lacustris]